jgi:hypothetical protein
MSDPLRLIVKLVCTFLLVGGALAMIMPVGRGSREAAYRSTCKNQLKQIALALWNYQDEYHAFPPAYTVNAEGKPLHSWRTLLLPYIEQKKLYDSIDLTKPWDDPVNAHAREVKIPVYHCPSSNNPVNFTTYMAIITPTSFIQPQHSRSINAANNAPEKLIVIEVSSNNATHWMSPVDADETLFYSLEKIKQMPHSGGSYGAHIDGSVSFIAQDISLAERNEMINYSTPETSKE